MSAYVLNAVASAVTDRFSSSEPIFSRVSKILGGDVRDIPKTMAGQHDLLIQLVSEGRIIKHPEYNLFRAPSEVERQAIRAKSKISKEPVCPLADVRLESV